MSKDLPNIDYPSQSPPCGPMTLTVPSCFTMNLFTVSSPLLWLINSPIQIFIATF